MQDVCISFWPEGEATRDQIVKVMDICSTDPSDPTYCASPMDIKVDRAKVQVMYNIPSPGIDNPDLQLPKYPKGTYWHFTKCWMNVRNSSNLPHITLFLACFSKSSFSSNDLLLPCPSKSFLPLQKMSLTKKSTNNPPLQALPQPGYADNWFGQPPLPNNFLWDIDATKQQYQNNQQSYPGKGWQTYPDGLEIPTPDSEANITPINDWVPGMEPAWAPIAGGKGFGTPERSKGPPPGLWPGQGTAVAGGGGGGNGTGGSEGGTAAVRRLGRRVRGVRDVSGH